MKTSRFDSQQLTRTHSGQVGTVRSHVIRTQGLKALAIHWLPEIHFLTPPVQPEGIWQAKLKLADGTCTTKTFSVRKHGERKAFGLAVAARREMLERAQDRPYLYDPLAMRMAISQANASAPTPVAAHAQ